MAPDRFDALLECARAGDQAAWAEIWAELSPAVLGYLRGSRAPDPDDVLSEAFLQVARDVKSFEGDWGRFRAWVFTIAHHRLIDARRHTARRPVDLVADPPEPPGASVEDALEKMQYDLYYVKHMSLMFDIVIALETIKIVILRRGAK